MFDLAGATQAAAQLMTFSSLNEDLMLANITMLPMRGDWATQITGAFDLMFKEMHQEFALRTEVDTALIATIAAHHAANEHFGWFSTRTNTLDAVSVTLAPKYTAGGPGLVRAGSAANAIGYGLGYT